MFLFLSSPLLSFQKGMALGLYSKNPHYAYQKELEEIQALGATHVSLIVAWYQKDSTSNKIYPLYPERGAYGDFDTTPDSKIIDTIQRAHHLGLKVFLFPILRLEERKDKEWRGNIKPSRKNIWLKSYQKFIGHYTKLASVNQVDLLAVGSELCSMESETLFWKKLIKNIRSHYQGQLLYSANWDHFKTINFWEDLDYLGLNGYYEVAPSPTATASEINEKWMTVETDVQEWQSKHQNKKLIFTEIGYPSIDGGCEKPWDYTRTTPVDLDEQALCYQSFFETWVQNKNFAGVYFWNWYGQGGPNDRTYTPRGKPAEKVLTEWYRNITK